jgi:transcriptional regulator with XRE-family HTH domain
VSEASLGYGYWIRSRREKLGLRVDDVAASTGINRGTIYGYEKDTFKPSLDNLQLLADAYGCLIGDLLPHVETAEERTPDWLRPIEATLAPFADDVRNRLIASITGHIRTMASIFLGQSPFLMATEMASPPYNMATPHSSTSVQGDSAAIPFSGGVRVREEQGGREESGSDSAGGGNHPQPPTKARKRRP